MTLTIDKELKIPAYKIDATYCFHCGNENSSKSIFVEDKFFCCNGCKAVYEILAQNNLCQYYDIENHPGLPIKDVNQPVFDFLDNDEIKSQIIHYQDDNTTKVSFYIPSVHCSSCIWILENFHRIDAATIESRVDFLKKQLFISFKTGQSSLRKIVESLTAIGYEPLISLQKENLVSDADVISRDLVSKIAVAGFCTGNIMMFSFPEYFGLDAFSKDFGYLFKYLNLVFSLPVLFYSGSVYFQSVFQSLKKGVLNIDAPILLGILATFFRSLIEVLSGNGAGYFDSMSGLIFLLLIGKWFTNKTFNFLSFERDYKSYFPLSVYKLDNDKEVPISVNSLQKGDKIRIKNNQIIPADAILYQGKAHIDFSFVTGESALITKSASELIYAGGRQKGGAIDLEIVKEVSQSYLTQLWNNEAFDKLHIDKTKNYQLFSNAVAKYFTIAILIIALSASFYWLLYDPEKSWNAFTAILIIACPCTLALSYPMAMGNMLRKMGKEKCYMKNIETIENLSNTDTIVFDKTGTLTESESFTVEWQGIPFTSNEKNAILSLASCSNHPLSLLIAKDLQAENRLEVSEFEEIVSKGICGEVAGLKVKLGKYDFVVNEPNFSNSQTKVHVSINDEYRGYFGFGNQYKSFIPALIPKLSETHQLYVLSGDGNAEEERLNKLLGEKVEMHFHQSPQQKLDFVKNLQSKGKKVVMCGDGLNDAGALQQANIGIAITQDASHFTPSSDVILEGNALAHLPDFINQAKQSMRAVKISFMVSLVYNCIGLSFAVRGDLQPIIAALLMPISSISVVMTAMIFSGNWKK